jgi:hypothetical protein
MKTVADPIHATLRYNIFEIEQLWEFAIDCTRPVNDFSGGNRYWGAEALYQIAFGANQNESSFAVYDFSPVAIPISAGLILVGLRRSDEPEVRLLEIPVIIYALDSKLLQFLCGFDFRMRFCRKREHISNKRFSIRELTTDPAPAVASGRRMRAIAAPLAHYVVTLTEDFC